MTFYAHARLFDQPDPRRIDLRASLCNIRRDWLVRTNHQRSSATISTIVDVSASMHLGSARGKPGIVTDFLQSLGYSAHRSGDSVGLMAFDSTFRDDLYMPARMGRGVGEAMASRVYNCDIRTTGGVATEGLTECVERTAGNGGIVFLLSDFHWSLDNLTTLLDKLADSLVVPLVVWDQTELEPPAEGKFLSVRDVESGQIRRLWLNKTTRQQWCDNVNARRREIADVFSASDIFPFYLDGGFEAEALSRYFLEKVV